MLKQLHYLDGDERQPMPDWGHFFISLGTNINRSAPGNMRTVIGLALPTRSYAAVLVGTGAVLSSLNRNKLTDGSDKDYFDKLCGLPRGTSIKFLDHDPQGRGRMLDGVVMECVDMPLRGQGGVEIRQKTLKIQLERSSMDDPKAGGHCRFVMTHNARNIRIVDLEAGIAPCELPATQRGTILAPTSKFSQCIIGADGLSDFNKESRLSCLIVGPLNHLRVETQESKFSIPTKKGKANPTFYDGCLLDLLRVRKFTSSGKAYRSEAFASNSHRPPTIAANAVPEVVIFDGALGFLKWRDSFQSSHWVVLLDQAEVRFPEGAQTLNNCYLQRTGDDTLPKSILAPPGGTEFVYFQAEVSR